MYLHPGSSVLYYIGCGLPVYSNGETFSFKVYEKKFKKVKKYLLMYFIVHLNPFRKSFLTKVKYDANHCFEEKKFFEFYFLS